MKKAIIIGATSGIGEALAKELIQQNYFVGLTGRRVERLQSFHDQFPNQSGFCAMDVSKTEEAIAQLNYLIKKIGGLDLIVVNAGVGRINRDCDWQPDLTMIEVNVLGFTAMADTAFQYFMQQRFGHLVGISSIAALRGNGGSPVYSASKAFVSNYLAGLRYSAFKKRLPILVTDIQPGFVDTPMTQGQAGMFWVAAPEKAACQIVQAIQTKRKHAYITRRWRLFAWLMKYLPDSIFMRLG